MFTISGQLVNDMFIQENPLNQALRKKSDLRSYFHGEFNMQRCSVAVSTYSVDCGIVSKSKPYRCLFSGLLRQECAQFDLPVHGRSQAGATVYSRAPIHCHHRRFVPAQRQHVLQSLLPIGQLEEAAGVRLGLQRNNTADRDVFKILYRKKKRIDILQMLLAAVMGKP